MTAAINEFNRDHNALATVANYYTPPSKLTKKNNIKNKTTTTFVETAIEFSLKTFIIFYIVL